MKKNFVLMFLVICLMSCGLVYADTVNLDFTYAESIDGSNEIEIRAYPITTSVTMGADQVFRILAPDNSGLIKEITIVTLSPLYNAWLSVTEDADILELDKNPIVLESIIYSESPTINPMREYRDIMGNKYLWLTISNQSATVTGTSGIIVISYWRSKT